MAGTLLYGSLDLSDSSSPFYAVGDGFSTGAPVSVATALPRLLLDGEVVSGDRSSNREMTFSIVVTGRDAVELAENEALLVAEATKPRNTLSWTPPGFAVATVFDTFRASLTHQFDDVTEVLQKQRTYQITIPALPFGRSQDAIITALAATTTVSATSLDACDAITNWSTTGGTINTDATNKQAGTASLMGSATDSFAWRGNQYQATVRVEMVRSAAFTVTSGAQYLRAWVRSTAISSNQEFRAFIDGVELQRIVVQPSSGGWVQIVWAAPVGSHSKVSFVRTDGYYVPVGTSTSTMGQSTFWVDKVELINTPVLDNASPNERMYSMDVAGSVRAPGGLQVSGTTALGSVLIHAAPTMPVGYTPDTSRWRTSARTPDVTAVSGNIDSITSAASGFAVALPAQLYQGAFAVLARIKWTGTLPTGQVQVTVTAGSLSTGSWVTPSSTYAMVPLGALHLPDVMVASRSTRTINATVSVNAGTMVIDEMWLLSLDGPIIQAELSAETNIWVESPTVEQPLGGVWVNTTNDRLSAYAGGPQLRALGQLSYSPPNTLLYVVTTGAANPALTLSYFPAWHTNAAS